jgi:hypothetical protein
MTFLAIILAIAGFIGDWANNADALLNGALEVSIGTIGRVCIALLFAGAVTVLGVASSHRKRYFAPAMTAVLGSACLTLYAQWGHVELRDAKASAEASRRPALEAERSDIQSALPACRLARWCDSQLKEARLREIDQQLAKTPETGNPGGEWSKELSYAMLFSVSILLPFTNYGLSSFAGFMMTRRKAAVQTQHTPTPPDGGKRKKEGFTEGFTTGQSLFSHVPANTAPVTAELKSVQPQSATATATDPDLRGFRHDTGVNDEASSRYQDLKKNIISGKVRPSLRQVRAHCKCRQDVAQKYLRALAEENIIERAGQGYKLAPQKTVKLKLVK